MRAIRNLVIHCTATSQKTKVPAIQRFWKTLGWQRPGYHLIINPDGSVIRLAEDAEVANGVAGHNQNSIHISYIGGVNRANQPIDNRTDAQKNTLVRLIKEYQSKYPNIVVLGHRDFPNVKKACPSFDVKTWMKTI